MNEEAVVSASVVADDTIDLTSQVDSTRTQLTQSRDNQIVAQLAELLCRLLFCLGHRADMNDDLELHQTLPDIGLAAFELVVTSFHPELDSVEHIWVQ